MSIAPIHAWVAFLVLFLLAMRWSCRSVFGEYRRARDLRHLGRVAEVLLTGRHSMYEIKKASGVSIGWTITLLDQLMTDGWITDDGWIAGEGRRFYRPTEQGAELLRAAAKLGAALDRI